MSTRINISVDGGGLRAQNRAEAQANRTKNLLAQEQRKVEEQGRQIVAAKRQDQAQTNNHHHFVPPSPQKDPAAQPDEYKSKVGHAWLSGSGTSGSNSSPGLVSVLGSISGVVVVFGFEGLADTSQLPPTFQSSTTFLASGSGVQQLTADQRSLSNPSLPSDNYTWQPTISHTYFTSSGGWRGVLGGMRLGNVQSVAESGLKVVALPAGNGRFVLLVFSMQLSYTVNANIMCGVQTGPYLGNFEDGPPIQPINDPNIQQYLQPGARVPRFDEFTAFNSRLDEGGTADVQIWDVYPELTVNIGASDRSNKAFLCSNNSVTEIAISGKLQGFMDYINPSISSQVTTPLGPPDGTPNFRGPAVSVPKFVGKFNAISDGGTVDIFAAINNLYPFTDPANIKTVPNPKWRSYVTPDTSAGGYATFPIEDAYSSGTPFYYIRGERNKPAKRHRSATLNLSPDRKPFNGGSLISVWDRDDPAYCRFMLSELGVELP
jgi:hypothetical protein